MILIIYHPLLLLLCLCCRNALICFGNIGTILICLLTLKLFLYLLLLYIYPHIILRWILVSLLHSQKYSNHIQISISSSPPVL